MLGRGKQYQDYPGNAKLFELVEKYRQPYINAESNFEKSFINQLIVKLVKESNGRFLKREKNSDGHDAIGGWIEVSDEVALTKVGRNYRK